VLPASEAVRMFTRVAGEPRLAGAAPGLVEQVVEHCGRLPLAIQIAAARLRARSGWTLAHLADRLQDERHRLAELAAGPRSLTAAFGLSYQHLTASRQRLFRLLGLVPGADIDRYAAAALADATPAHADRLLEDLVDAHLLEAPAPYRYRCHDLLRQYAARCAGAEPAPERRAALTRLLDHYAYAAQVAAGTRQPDPPPPVARPATAIPVLDRPDLAAAWLDAERPNLLAAAGYAAGHGWPRHAIWLSRILFHHLDRQARLADAEQLHSLARDAAELIGDRTAQADALRSLARIDARRGRMASAQGRLGQALELYQQTGDRSGEAHTRYGLGVVEASVDRYPPALAHYRRALALYRQTGDLVSRARTLHGLSEVHRRLGRHRHALAQLRQALAIHRRLGNADGEARIEQSLGDVYLLMGQAEQARPHLEAGLATHRRTGNIGCQAAALDSLGRLHQQLGRYDLALELQREALAVHRHNGALGGEAETLNDLGHTLRAAGRAGDALADHQRALALAGRFGYPYEQARAHAGLGHAYQALGRHDRARDHWREALDRFTRLGVPEAAEIRARLDGYGVGSRAS
jgi:tetratricopeptide (TPR) repeat protein